LKKYFPQIFSTYKELFRTGGILSTAESDKLCIDVHGNVAGDILVFISPKNNTSSGQDIMDLIRSDTDLAQQWNTVIKSMRQKFNGITLLPKIIAWLINVIILYLIYFRLPFDRIMRMAVGNDFVTQVIFYFPFLLPFLTLFYGKAIGFKFLKPLISVIIRIIRLIRTLRNSKVA
jgi:hypothetical protein